MDKKSRNQVHRHPVASLVRSEIRRAIVYAGIIGIFCALLQVAVPLYMMQVYDRVLGTFNLDTLLVLTLIVSASVMVWGILDYLETQLVSAAGHATATALSQVVLPAAIEMRGPSRSRASQVVRDLADVRSFYASPAVAVPVDAALSPILSIVLFMLHPVYFVIALAGMILMVGFSATGRVASRTGTVRANDELIRLSSDMDSAYRSNEAIISMGMLPALTQRWNARFRGYLAATNEAGRRTRSITAAAKVTRMMLQVSLYAAGAALVIEHAVAPGSMFAASLIVARVLAPYERLVDSWRSWMSARDALERLESVLADEPEARHRTNTAPAGHLSFDRVAFVPPSADKPIVRGVSFQLRGGEALGVIGPSASGKTTLVRLAVGLLAPSAGGVFLDGQNVRHWDPSDLGAFIGYLPQSVALLDGTVAENIGRLETDNRDRVIEAARRAGAHELIGRLPRGYDTPVGEAGAMLSGGQRQIIALARAMYGEPRLLVLDEPNAHLDPNLETAVLTAIGHAKAWGASVIVVAHKLNVMSCVDKVAVLKNGVFERIIERADIGVPQPIARQFRAGPVGHIQPAASASSA